MSVHNDSLNDSGIADVDDLSYKSFVSNLKCSSTPKCHSTNEIDMDEVAKKLFLLEGKMPVHDDSGIAHDISYKMFSAEDPNIPNSTTDDKFIEFQKFIKEHEREYRNVEEFQIRYKLFCDSLKAIDDLNNAPGQTATFGINHFSDRTEHEKKRNFGLKRPN